MPIGLNLVSSLIGWLFVAVGTVILSLMGLVFFWPISLLFEGGNGRLLHLVSRFWARLISRALPFWKIRVEGLQHIERGKPYVVVSNHQSMLDILVLLAVLPLHFKFIAKRELFWIPFLGWHLALARYICLQRGDPESGRQTIQKAKDWIRQGVSVVFFPEGTRSPDGEIHEFKVGAFKVALEEKADLLPLVIGGTREAIPKRSWRLRKRTTLFLKVLDPVPAKDLSTEALDELRDRIRSQIIREFHQLKAGG